MLTLILVALAIAGTYLVMRFILPAIHPADPKVDHPGWQQKAEQYERELHESLQQQIATGEILRVISRSPTDLQPVLDAIAENAARLCDARDVLINRVQGERLKIVAHYGTIPIVAEDEGLPIDRSVGSGRAVLDRCLIHLPDVLAESDAEFGALKDMARRVGVRTLLVAPLLRQGMAIGTISIRRVDVSPFTTKQIELLKTFADQAVIAIENTRLFNELQERLEQQAATSEILRVISQSQRDVQPVFETIAANARKLCTATMGAVFTFDGQLIQHVASDSVSPEALEAIHRTYPMPPSRAGVVARSILDQAVVYISDVLEDTEYRLQGLAEAAGYRSSLSVPCCAKAAPSELSASWVPSRRCSTNGRSLSSRPSPIRP